MSGYFMAVKSAISKAIDTLKASFAASNGAGLVGYIQAGTGAVARTAQDKLREIVDVRDFGASTSNANNTDQIQAALDYAASIGGAIVRIPAGVFKIASTLTVGSNIQLLGATLGYGSYSSTVLQYTGNGVAVQIGAGAYSSGFYSRIADLTIKNAGTGTIGIYIRATQTQIENVTIMGENYFPGFSDSGIKTDYLGGTTFTHLLRRVYVYGCGTGIYLRVVNNVVIDACFIESNGTGIYIVDSTNIVISNGTVLECFGDLPRGAETATSACIEAVNVNNLIVRDYYAEVAANVTAPLGQRFARLQGVSGGCIEGGYIYTEGTNSAAYPLIDIQDSNVKRVSIQHNRVLRMGTNAYIVGASGTGKLANNVIGNNIYSTNSYEYNNTWTPTLLIGGSSSGITGTFEGLWWRHGSHITINGSIYLTSKGSNTGVVSIGNLPLSMQPRLSSNTMIVGTLFMSGVAQSTAQSFSRIRNAESSIRLQYRLTSSANETAYVDTDLANTSQIQFQITYPVEP